MSSSYEKHQKRRLISSYFSVVISIALVLFLLGLLGLLGGILEILWSIGIEEQFYLIVAPLLFVVNNKYVLYFILDQSIMATARLKI